MPSLANAMCTYGTCAWLAHLPLRVPGVLRVERVFLAGRGERECPNILKTGDVVAKEFVQSL
jgi:hypothetical protein